jgi:nicotinamidase-related amidase
VTPRAGTALVVVDLQNDFCAGPVVAARYRGDRSRLDTAIRNTGHAVETARRRGTEVVFVRFHGDVGHQGPSWRRRDAVLGKRPKCLEGSWGAEFHTVSPTPGEHVFTKRACFDAFLDDGFGRHLEGREHLVFAGLYTDVCVDSTARTAFQRGFHVTVLTDCTTSLHLPDETILGFMRTVYGARTTTHDRPEVWSPPGQRTETWPEPSNTTPSASNAVSA